MVTVEEMEVESDRVEVCCILVYFVIIKCIKGRYARIQRDPHFEELQGIGVNIV